MLVLTTISYKFNINGEHTKILTAKRGIRQRDPLSRFLFVIVIEYLHRSLDKLKEVPDFNYHSKCEKLNITNLSFVDDLLLFTRGNNNFLELVMRIFYEFYRSIWLKVNPSKCIVNFGGVDESGRAEIQ